MNAMIKVDKNARAIPTDYNGSGWYDWFVPITTEDGYLIGIHFKRDRNEFNDWPQDERWYYLYDIADDDDDDPNTYYVSAVELACMWAEILASELTPEEENEIRESLGENET